MSTVPPCYASAVAGPLIALLCVGLSVALAWSYPRHVARFCTLDGRTLAKAMSLLPPAERVAQLQRLARAGSWESELGRELAGAGDDRARAIAANDALAGAEHELLARRGRPHAAAFLAATSTLACAAGGYLWESDGAWERGLLAILYVVPIALLGVALCLQASSIGRRRAALQRANIDALVAAVLGELHHRDLALPTRRRMRWRDGES